jgi:hypothetical protein
MRRRALRDDAGLDTWPAPGEGSNYTLGMTDGNWAVVYWKKISDSCAGFTFNAPQQSAFGDLSPSRLLPRPPIRQLSENQWTFATDLHWQKDPSLSRNAGDSRLG